jgi:Tol biopolymer transport system component
MDGSNERQITFDQEPDVALGVPYWSPRGDWIIFIVSRAFQTGLAIVRPDGGDRRTIGPERCWHASWSPDGKWIYYSTPHEKALRLERFPVDGGEPVVVSDSSTGGVVVVNDAVKYISNRVTGSRSFGRWSGESELLKVADDGSVEGLARVPGTRVPVLPMLFQPQLSPDATRLAVPLIDGATTNIWSIPADGGPLGPLTDFGSRSILIARSISWAHDSRSIVAAIAEIETDVVLFDGLTD